jgi:hypothetical protein
MSSQAVQIEEEVFYQKAKPNITEDLKSTEIKNPHLCMLRAYISKHSTNYVDKLRENNVAHTTKMGIYNFNTDFFSSKSPHIFSFSSHIKSSEIQVVAEENSGVSTCV